MSLFRGCPGAINIREARPEEITCPRCGSEVEIWSDELSARCPQCGCRVSRERGPSCIDWCSFAEQCVGTEKYQRLKRGNSEAEDESGPASTSGTR
jgi:DNA-directed RNA polymerase subunit RPC12/RpoP